MQGLPARLGPDQDQGAAGVIRFRLAIPGIAAGDVGQFPRRIRAEPTAKLRVLAEDVAPGLLIAHGALRIASGACPGHSTSRPAASAIPKLRHLFGAYAQLRQDRSGSLRARRAGTEDGNGQADRSSLAVAQSLTFAQGHNITGLSHKHRCLAVAVDCSQPGTRGSGSIP